MYVIYVVLIEFILIKYVWVNKIDIIFILSIFNVFLIEEIILEIIEFLDR